ncbi:MAG: hypothetical protein IPH20_24370 [Bacteroidales bacterium]|nr:hypothetical protein [Bacteroidales bacterium]
MAKRFVRESQPLAILLLPPEFSYKYNFKIPDIENFDSLPKLTQDSLLYYNSELLQYMNDSLFINGYINGMSSGLKSLGFNVHTSESSESFVSRGSEGLILNIAQIELEEYFDSISENASFGDEELYSYELYLTALNINSWFELTRVNHQDTTLVLYTSNTLTDQFEGGFRYFPFSGDVKYEFTIDSLRVDEIYPSVFSFGNLYAGYLFDFLMNDYISRNLPAGYQPSGYYTYDRLTGAIRKNNGQRLIRLN